MDKLSELKKENKKLKAKLKESNKEEKLLPLTGLHIKPAFDIYNDVQGFLADPYFKGEGINNIEERFEKNKEFVYEKYVDLSYLNDAIRGLKQDISDKFGEKSSQLTSLVDKWLITDEK